MKIGSVKSDHFFKKDDHSKKGIAIFQFIISILKECEFLFV
ncbi:hypothetical protein LEP1GSC062_3746 [Leptospira alexanderi serovar Manhao 3 str. L 60]|uniref:Uncharacterized protein n=1 Tax=Leptospira alexanderi serovar Manhao 3 str. L 60 TaxID=1049759 RepID=V6IF20_9LEPT|nr:hypothetical protein LEP1GSC062_3746 [Leptospira alexanderi serovar Manhao 3 str. L 60]